MSSETFNDNLPPFGNNLSQTGVPPRNHYGTPSYNNLPNQHAGSLFNQIPVNNSASAYREPVPSQSHHVPGVPVPSSQLPAHHSQTFIGTPASRVEQSLTFRPPTQPPTPSVVNGCDSIHPGLTEGQSRNGSNGSLLGFSESGGSESPSLSLGFQSHQPYRALGSHNQNSRKRARSTTADDDSLDITDSQEDRWSSSAGSGIEIPINRKRQIAMDIVQNRNLTADQCNEVVDTFTKVRTFSGQ